MRQAADQAAFEKLIQEKQDQPMKEDKATATTEAGEKTPSSMDEYLKSLRPMPDKWKGLTDTDTVPVTDYTMAEIKEVFGIDELPATPERILAALGVTA